MEQEEKAFYFIIIILAIIMMKTIVILLVIYIKNRDEKRIISCQGVAITAKRDAELTDMITDPSVPPKLRDAAKDELDKRKEKYKFL
jgi:hypothetical protein